MNVLAVQNPRHKCDLGNKYDTITQWQENNCPQYMYLTVIIITIITIITLWLCYICVCVWLTTYTSTPTSRRAVLKSRLEEFRKQFGGFNVEEMKWAELEINRKLWASSKL